MLFPVVGELSCLLPGDRVDKVVQTEEGGYCLQLYRSGSKHLLLLAPDRQLPRLHLVTRKPAAAAVSTGFLLSLRKHLSGGRITHVGIINEDRLVEIGVARPGRTVRLVFELTGASANIVLTDQEGIILSVLRPRAAERPDQRMLLGGTRYEPPVRRDASAPSRPTVCGVPPAGASASGAMTANAFAESFFAKVAQERETGQLRMQLQRSVAGELRKAGRKVEALRQDLARSERAEEYQAAGSLILENLTVLRRGQSAAELAGYDGTIRTVSLDPAKSPTENADRWFRRAKKARAALAVVRDRLAVAQERAEALKIALDDIPRAHDREALLSLQEMLLRSGMLRERGGDPSMRTNEPAAAYRTVRFGAWVILVGRSAAGNDLLTTRLARPDDLWLHAEGMPGSHVVVRNPDRGAVPDEVLLRAAGLAAYFSKGRGAAKVPVAYTAARFVRKPKGARPGSVLLEERRTIMARPEPVTP